MARTQNNMSSHIFLPIGWVEATDPKSGRKYYANPTTRETRWDPPPLVSSSAAPSTTAAPSALSKAHSGSGGSSGATSRGLGQSGNKLYTAPTVNTALAHPSTLVPVARAMLDKAGAFPDETVASDVELNSITAGQIADLCRIQHKTVECGERVAYTPLNPFRMSAHSHLGGTEEGRLDVRLSALRRELQKRQSTNDGFLYD